MSEGMKQLKGGWGMKKREFKQIQISHEWHVRRHTGLFPYLVP